MSTELATQEATSRSRAKKIDKRQAIVEAARDLFTTEGYETTTIADVARRAGVAVGTVYLYFKNKTDLLYGVKEDWDAEFLDFLSRPEIQAIPHHMRARPLMEACFALCAQRQDMVQLMGLQPEMIGNWHDKDGGPIVQALEVFFDEAVALGSFRPVDTRIAAVIAYGIVYNALYHCFEVEGGKDQARYINVLVDTFEHWLVWPELLQR
jgi:AcrR family transcriptional regulator